MDRDVECSTNCLPADVLVGDYRILGVIGEGGFGIVYRALDLSLDREVALKEYLPATLAGRQSASHRVHVRSQHRGAFDAGLRSFINEARLLARFSHPTLVHVYRFFESGGTAYMVMRRYQGRTLRQVLDNPSLRVDQVWLGVLLGPLLDVLELLHAEDCFHRDIAPDNIFLQEDGSPVLLDFGAARRIIGDMTQALTMVLKPGFAPIEQYVDDGAMPQGAWTDIYQIGALIYRTITGKTPTTSVARMVNDPLLPLTPEQVPGFSEEFLRGVHCALAVRPQDRPQSIAELKTLLGFPPLCQGAEPAALDWAGGVLSASAEAAAGLHAPDVDLRRQPTVLFSGALPPVSAQMASAASPVLPVLEESISPMEGSGLLPAGQEIVPESPALGGPGACRPASTIVSENESGPRRRRPMTSVFAVCAVVALLAGGLWLFGRSSPDSEPDTQVARELAFWQEARAQHTAIRLQEYLERFPNGAHRNEAQALLLQAQSGAGAVIVETEPAPQAEFTPAVASASTESASMPELPLGKAVTESVVPPPSVPNASSVKEDTGPATLPVVMGKVIFRIAPWGYVSVNRAPAKTSPPLTQLRLPEGQYRIDISNPGATASITRTIEIKRGEPVTVSYRFE